MTASLGGAATYTLTPLAGDVSEGSSIAFEVSGSGISNGTYYWTVESNTGDFFTNSGDFIITSNYGQFTVSPDADNTTEGSETFTVSIRSGSTSGPILATSNSITINDTSFNLGTMSVNGSSFTWGSTNASTPTYGAYTFPDESTGSVHTLNGTQYVLSRAFGVTPTVNFNLWFYPTSNNVNVISELGTAVENSAYHYSMLEIDSTGKLKGRVWQMGTPLTSVGSVNLNAWNHVYFYYDHSNTTFGISLNNETTVVSNVGGVRLTSDTGNTYWGIGLFESTYMVTTARYQGKFSDLSIHSTIAGSNYTATKSAYTAPALVVNLDAGNAASYPGSGSTWTNLVDSSTYTINNGSYDSGGSIIFNGTSTYVDIGTPITSGNYTIESWVYADAVNQSHNIVSSENNVFWVASGSLFGGVGGNYTLVSTGITTGAWKHVVLTFNDNSNTMKLYVNGDLVSTNPSVTQSYASETLRIGCHYAGTPVSFWDGNIAQVRIYNGSISAADILSRFNTTKATFGY